VHNVVSLSQNQTVLYKNIQMFILLKLSQLKPQLLRQNLNFIHNFSKTTILTKNYFEYSTSGSCNHPNSKSLRFQTRFSEKTIALNYKRNRFFPTLLNKALRHTYLSLSLGIFWSFFSKPKSFKKSKQLYLLLTHFFQKLIRHTLIPKLTLLVKFVPKYFTELITILLTNGSVLENSSNPFTSQTPGSASGNNKVNHPSPLPLVTITRIIFSKTKNYGITKTRKKGTVKRKILRKVYKNNSITD